MEQAISGTEAEIRRSEQERADALHQVEEETEYLQPLFDEGDGYVADIYRLHAQIQALTEEEGDIDRQLPEEEARFSEFTGQLAAIADQRTRAESQLVDVQRSLERTRVKIEFFERLATRFQGFRAFSQLIDRLQENNDEFLAQRTTLLGQVQGLLEQERGIRQSLDALSAPLAAHRARKNAVIEERQVAQGEFDTAWVAFQQVAEQIHVAQDAIAKIQDAADELFFAINRERDLLQDQQREYESVSSQAAAQQQQLATEREYIGTSLHTVNEAYGNVDPPQTLSSFEEAARIFREQHDDFMDACNVQLELSGLLRTRIGEREAADATFQGRLEALANLIAPFVAELNRSSARMGELQTAMDIQAQIKYTAAQVNHAISMDNMRKTQVLTVQEDLLATIAADVAQHRQSLEGTRASLHAAVERAMEESERIDPMLDAVTGNRKVTVQFQSPADASKLELALTGPDAAWYNSVTVEHPGGTRTGTATLVMPIGLSARQVVLKIKDPEGTVLASMNLTWNGQRFTAAGNASEGSVISFVSENIAPTVNLTDPGVRLNFEHRLGQIANLYPTQSARDVAKGVRPEFFGATPQEDEAALEAYADLLVRQNPGLNWGRLLDSLRLQRQSLLTESQRTLDAAYFIIKDVAAAVYGGFVAGETGDLAGMNQSFQYAEDWFQRHSKRRDLTVPLAMPSVDAMRSAIWRTFYDIYEESLFWKIQDDECRQRIINMSNWGLIGTTILPDGTIIRPNGTVHHPDGSISVLEPGQMPENPTRSTKASRDYMMQWMVTHWNDPMLDGFRDIEDPAERRVAMLEALYGDHNLWTDTGAPPPEDNGEYYYAPDDEDVEREVGGAGEIDINTLSEDTLQRALGWFENPNQDPVVRLHETYINTATMGGQLFMGFYQQIVNARDDYELRLASAQMEKITGIDQGTFFSLTGLRGDRRFFERLQFLFSENLGFTHIFRTENADFPASPPVHANTDSVFYRNGFIRVAFDVPKDINGKDIDLTSVYLVGADDHRILSDIHFGGEVRTRLYVMTSTTIIGSMENLPRDLAFKVVSTAEGANREGYSNNFIVEWDGTLDNPVGDYSTQPLGPAHNRENIILTTIANHFMVREPTSWRWDLGSGYHDGNGVNAIDLNRGSGFADRGEEIHSPEAGNVVRVDVYYGILEISHTTRGIQWKSEILHMPVQKYVDGDGKVVADKFTVQQITERYKIGNSGETELVNGDRRIVYEKNGDTYRSWIEVRNAEQQWVMQGKVRNSLSADDLVGFVSNQDGSGVIKRTSPTTYSPHLHYEAIDTLMATTMDFRKLILSMRGPEGDRMSVTAADAGPDQDASTPDGDRTFDVDWNEQEQRWVTIDEHNPNGSAPWLMYDRSVQEDEDRADGTTPAYWVAWHTDPQKRERVVWVLAKEEGYEQGIARWRSVEDYSKVWDPTSRDWIDVQLLP